MTWPLIAGLVSGRPPDRARFVRPQK